MIESFLIYSFYIEIIILDVSNSGIITTNGVSGITTSSKIEPNKRLGPSKIR